MCCIELAEKKFYDSFSLDPKYCKMLCSERLQDFTLHCVCSAIDWKEILEIYLAVVSLGVCMGFFCVVLAKNFSQDHFPFGSEFTFHMPFLPSRHPAWCRPSVVRSGSEGSSPGRALGDGLFDASGHLGDARSVSRGLVVQSRFFYLLGNKDGKSRS